MILRRMPPAVRAALDAELAAARAAGDSGAFWRAAERAHILSQPWPGPHTWTHAVMLRRALAEHDRVEAVGQLVRLLVAGPGSAVGRYPEGNTGRARVRLTQPMPVPTDLVGVLSAAPPGDEKDNGCSGRGKADVRHSPTTADQAGEDS